MHRYLWVMIVGQFAALQLAAQEIDYSQLKIAVNWFHRILYSPDGKALAWFNKNKDKSITLVDTANGKQQAKLTVPNYDKLSAPNYEKFSRIAFAPDGKTLATSHGSSITLWVVQ